MGLLDSNRPFIKTFDPVSYDMSVGGTITSIDNSLGYRTLVLQVKITKGSDDVTGGKIRVRGQVSLSASWSQPLDVFDQYGNLYGYEYTSISLDRLGTTMEASTSRLFYVNVSGLKNIYIFNHYGINATCEVVASLTDAPFTEIVNRKPIQVLSLFTFTGDGTTKNFGATLTSRFYIKEDFKYLAYIVRSSASISGKLNSYNSITDGAGDYRSKQVTIAEIDGTSMETEWKENNGLLAQTMLLSLDTAPAEGVTIRVEVIGIR